MVVCVVMPGVLTSGLPRIAVASADMAMLLTVLTRKPATALDAAKVLTAENVAVMAAGTKGILHPESALDVGQRDKPTAIPRADLDMGADDHAKGRTLWAIHHRDIAKRGFKRIFQFFKN